VGGPATYVEHGVTGVLVDPAESLAPAIRAALALRAGADRVVRAQSMVRERYSIGRFADQLAGVYAAALADASALR
jgi:glycosyltransferase involved in cell wall biosynthesis